MRSDVEKVIRQFFPDGEYVHPRKNPKLPLSRKTVGERREIYDIIGELRSKVDRRLVHSTAQEGNLAEVLHLCEGAIALKLSFLGPFAALDLTRSKSIVESRRDFLVRRINMILEKYEVLLLADEELKEVVPWLKSRLDPQSIKITVGKCLFGEEPL